MDPRLNPHFIHTHPLQGLNPSAPSGSVRAPYPWCQVPTDSPFWKMWRALWIKLVPYGGPEGSGTGPGPIKTQEIPSLQQEPRVRRDPAESPLGLEKRQPCPARLMCCCVSQGSPPMPARLRLSRKAEDPFPREEKGLET